MSAPDRGVCPNDGKARFTYDEANEKVEKARRRGKAFETYRCRACGGWWHLAHADTDSDGHGGGVRREKKRLPNSRVRRASKGLRR